MGLSTLLPLLLLSALAPPTQALNNGVARTPPLGWLSWQRYRCNMNCTADPDNCFSEKLIKKTIDAMAAGGYKEAGYEYVNLDDCWQAEKRDATGHLQANENFPSGIKSLVNYAHGKGLKLGIYTAMGNGTCANDNGECDNRVPSLAVSLLNARSFVLLLTLRVRLSYHRPRRSPGPRLRLHADPCVPACQDGHR